jgi:hypothetical protein
MKSDINSSLEKYIYNNSYIYIRINVSLILKNVYKSQALIAFTPPFL